jgi:octaprenyl-diphosphate synthase
MTTATLEPVQNLIADEMRAVDEVIHARLHSEVALVRQVSEYIVSAGGKRLRPGSSSWLRACGYSGTAHYTLAAVVEFIHTATLLHDDVVDESGLRRGRATANSLFGNPASVLVGDFLYSRAFQMMVELKDIRVMEVLANATNTIAEGEVLQLLNCHDPEVSEEHYLHVIRYKTARLFEAASQLGAIVSHASREVEEGLSRYGMP